MSRSRALLPGAAVAVLVTATAAAAPPANDARSAAATLTVPDRVTTSLREATAERGEPNPFCGPRPGASVWYRLPAGVSGRVGVEIRAAEGDGTLVAVFRQQGGSLLREDCAVSDRTGMAAVRVTAEPGVRYLVQVAAGTGTDPGAFALTTFRPDPAPRLPAPALAAGILRGRLDGVRNTEDAGSVALRPGVTYRVALWSPGACTTNAHLLAPGARSVSDRPVLAVGCDGYRTITPRPGEGGRHTVVPFTSRTARGVPYRLIVAPAGPDDLAPGLPLPIGARSATVAGRGVDRVDVWSLEVERRSRIRLRLATTGAVDLRLYTEGGRLLECACGEEGDLEVERAAAQGRYLAVVRAAPGAGGRYRLVRTQRTITAAATLVQGSRSATVPVGRTVRLAVRVTPAPEGGAATMDVEQFDPVEGWVFRRRFTPAVSGGVAAVSWAAPAAGRWRVRGSYLGSPSDSPSPGGTARITAR